MNKAEQLRSQTSLPVIVAPMFILSDADFVVAACKEGLVGTFPALNGRTTAEFEAMLRQVTDELAAHGRENPGAVIAPYGVNLVVHRINKRLDEDLDLCVRFKVPMIVTNLGKPDPVIEAVHGYGGLVFSSVTTFEYARKVAAAGVDGLVLICAGAGGHAGTINPFAFVPGVREFFDGIIALAGCISDGYAIRACEVLGADFAWIGTRFIATLESKASQPYKNMLLEAVAADIIYTPAVSGIPANFIRGNLLERGFDIDARGDVTRILDTEDEYKLWKDIWTAGQGVQTIHEITSIKALTDTLRSQYQRARLER